jgi:hypothetical protein
MSFPVYFSSLESIIFKRTDNIFYYYQLPIFFSRHLGRTKVYQKEKKKVGVVIEKTNDAKI